MTYSILVTGGAGFIGSHVVESLLKSNHNVIVYDNFSSGHLDNLPAEKPDNLKIIEGDILDYENLYSSMKGVNYVSHHAAQLEIFLAQNDPLRDLHVNTIGTLNVLRAAKQNNVSKVVNISSACVYGQATGHTSENDTLTPNWDYGVSKLAAEKYAKIFNDYKGLPTVSLRYGIVYGEREWYRRVLPIFLKRVINNQAPVVFGEGDQVRDFIYVKDVVEFHNICMFDSRANGFSFNVGTGIATTVKQLADTILKVSKLDLDVIYENTREGEFSSIIRGKKRNSAELGTMLLNMTQAFNILGWKPATTLEEGLLNELLWASSNLDKWDTIFSTQW